MVDEYKDKLRATILTNVGRDAFLQIGDGAGTLVYTRAVLSSQSMNDRNGRPLANEIIFSTSIPLPLYIGVGGQISSTSIWSANTVWWTGWKAKTNNQIYAGVKGRINNTSIWSTETS